MEDRQRSCGNQGKSTVRGPSGTQGLESSGLWLKRPESLVQALLDVHVKDRKGEKKSKGRGEIKYILTEPKHAGKASMINRSNTAKNTEEELPPDQSKPHKGVWEAGQLKSHSQSEVGREASRKENPLSQRREQMHLQLMEICSPKNLLSSLY